MSLIIDEHRQYLSDLPRISAYRHAIGEVVKPGDVVVDLGAGTGIMGLLACEAGAGRVYSIESDSIIELTRAISRANGFDGRVCFLKAVSTQVDLPEKADVVVSDQIGRFGFEAGILEYFSDARRRFLKPGGALIPSRISMHIAPVESDSLFAQVSFWNGRPAGFDVSPVRWPAANTGYPAKLSVDSLLGGAAQLLDIDLATFSNSQFSSTARIPIARKGTLHGLGGWFSARLSTHVTMSNSPLDAQAINRRNVFLPIDRPVPVEEGDCLRVRIGILPADTIVTWNVEVVAAGGAEKASFAHSTWNGSLVSKEDLAHTELRSVPTLSPRGQARLTVLSLCDGVRTLADVERETFNRHPALFRAAAEAALFVAEVVTRYAR